MINGYLFETKEEAQAWCDKITAALDFPRRGYHVDGTMRDDDVGMTTSLVAPIQSAKGWLVPDHEEIPDEFRTEKPVENISQAEHKAWQTVELKREGRIE